MTPPYRRGRLNAVPILVSNLPAESISLPSRETGHLRLFGLEYQSCKQTIRSITSDAAVNPHFGLTNLPTTLRRCLKMPFERMSRRVVMVNMTSTFIRCVRRMPGFEGLWSNYQNSSSETSLTQGDAAVNRTDDPEFADGPRFAKSLVIKTRRTRSATFTGPGSLRWHAIGRTRRSRPPRRAAAGYSC